MRDNTRRVNPAAYNTQVRQEPSPQERNVSVPSFYVDLPSKGIFYPKDHPLHNKDKVEIKEMTAREEEILSSQEYLKAGVAIDKFLDSVIVDLNIDPYSIVLADRDAIVYESRKMAYGSEIYLENYECPSCKTKQKRKLKTNISTISCDYSEVADHAIVNEDGCIEFTLSNNSSLVMAPIDVKAENEIIKKVQETPDTFVNLLLKEATLSIDGETDKDKLAEMMMNIPARDSRRIRQTYQKMLPQHKASASFQCKSCDHSQELEVPLNADWFWLVD